MTALVRPYRDEDLWFYYCEMVIFQELGLHWSVGVTIIITTSCYWPLDLHRD